jgi:hypothetical protein
VRFEPGQLLSAEWDGNGSWRILEVIASDGDSVEVRLFADEFPGPPARGAIAHLEDRYGESQTISADALALMWPAELEPAPEERRSTRRGLLGGLLRGGIERGEDLARRRRPWR